VEHTITAEFQAPEKLKDRAISIERKTSSWHIAVILHHLPQFLIV